MRMKAGIIAMLGCTVSLSALAGIIGAPLAQDHRPWSVVGSLGYTWYNSFYDGGGDAQAAIGDGQTALGRFAIAKNLGIFKTVRLGVEMGVQNGDTARLNLSQSAIDALGGLIPQVTIKPMLDLLATASWQPVENSPLFVVIKPGIAYRRL